MYESRVLLFYQKGKKVWIELNIQIFFYLKKKKSKLLDIWGENNIFIDIPFPNPDLIKISDKKRDLLIMNF